MIRFLQRQRAPSSVLGLALDGSRLEGAWLRRSNGSLRLQKAFAATLALNPLTSDPELVGREIRNHLDHAGIRERRSAVCLPPSWALTLPVQVPDLPEADAESFLQIEAEKGFPYTPEALSIVSSRFRSASQGGYATLVAVPRNHLAQLERALRAAQLRPVSFTLGTTVLQSPLKESSQGVLALVIGESSVDLQVTCGGGLAALRALDGAIETEGAQRRLHADLIAREVRITLGQLPAEFRETVRRVNVFGRGESVQRLVSELTPRLLALGLHTEEVNSYRADEFPGSQVPPDAQVTPALSVAAKNLSGARACFEFLPPKVQPWQRLTARFSSKKLMWAGATAGSAALLVLGAFLAQQWQLSRLQSKWTAMEPKVKELENLQHQIRKFRPWFDNSFRNLSILRSLTEAFPEEGVIFAKTVEIRAQNVVTCSGSARDTQAFLKTLDQLRTAKEVGGLTVERISGKAPLQFSFNFHWGEGGGDAN